MLPGGPPATAGRVRRERRHSPSSTAPSEVASRQVTYEGPRGFPIFNTTIRTGHTGGTFRPRQGETDITDSSRNFRCRRRGRLGPAGKTGMAVASVAPGRRIVRRRPVPASGSRERDGRPRSAGQARGGGVRRAAVNPRARARRAGPVRPLIPAGRHSAGQGAQRQPTGERHSGSPPARPADRREADRPPCSPSRRSPRPAGGPRAPASAATNAATPGARVGRGARFVHDGVRAD